MKASYEFNQWEIVFKLWRGFTPEEKKSHQIVISTHHYTSGYWVEPIGTDLTNGDYKYVGKEVDELMKRVETEIETAEKQERGVVFTL